ncbi:MAG: NAD(P)H-hydrate epimerase [Acidimicrobiia bacterium]|nr:NAD(P)H-hydrate epimerase [Acidimicrobiia bacterium]
MEIPWAEVEVPYLTREQMIEVDRAMIEDIGIDLARMMENAGRSLAHLARARFLSGDPRSKTVVVLAGTGGNGGGALVCARRLHGWGADVRVAVTGGADRMRPVPADQLRILEGLGLSIVLTDLPFATADLIVDGIIGYSLQGAPRGRAAELIQWANDAAAPVLSLDTPSGLDTTSGTLHTPSVQATATMTLALPKEGLRSADAVWNVGELYLADISVPPQVYASPPLNLELGPIFAESDILRLA